MIIYWTDNNYITVLSWVVDFLFFADFRFLADFCFLPLPRNEYIPVKI
jgi:hypothetical protein